MSQWKKGQSGNPNGRPPGTGKIAELRALLEPHSAELVDKAIRMALDGDTTCMRLCLERLVPPIKIKDEPLTVEGLNGDAPIAEQGEAIIDALSIGDITPGEASSLIQTISYQAKIIETTELEERLTVLEKQYEN